MKVLIVDDDPVSRFLLNERLIARGLTPLVAESGQEGLAIFERDRPPICIVDWVMPGLTGPDLVSEMRRHPAGEGAYIVMLTGRQRHDHLLEAFSRGVNDFIRKPVESGELDARLTAALRVIDLQERLKVQVAVTSKLNDELRRANVDLTRLATIDAGSGLLNRRAGYERLEALWRQAEADGTDIACAMIDIDHFKRVNDTHGHEAGDNVIRAVAEALAEQCGEGDVVARFGGEEFVVTMSGCSAQAGRERMEALRARVSSTPVATPTTDVSVTISIGVATRRKDGGGVRSVLRAADEALYAAKRGGRNRVVIAADCAEIESPACAE